MKEIDSVASSQVEGDVLIHDDFEAEKAHLEEAHRQLDAARSKVDDLHSNVEVVRGGTHQAKYERDVISETVNERQIMLDIGDQSLIFGRIDIADQPTEVRGTGHSGAEAAANPNRGQAFHIGRVAVFNDDHDPLVVDWRAPVAEPFYRATGVEPLGLARRRHFATRGRELLGIEDEFFGEGSEERNAALGLATSGGPAGVKGEQTLIAALETARTGKLGDIVGTIQGEQDEVIRSPLPGILIVQGGPGTGKTVVALHRAAYLLYTHRFPLAGQGVLVVGPNRLFLTYIEQVLPSLGESGVELVVLADLVSGVRVQGSDPQPVGRVKGHPKMATVVRRAVRHRERELRQDLVIGHGAQRIRLTVEDSREIIASARRRGRTHNHGRKFVVQEAYERLAASGRYELEPKELAEQLRGTFEMRETLEWMWPVLTPAQLLHDLYGSKALLRAAGSNLFSDDELALLYRERTRASDVLWTTDDVPLLDEAHAHLGSRPNKAKKGGNDTQRTYGHIVIDEAQDLSPMQLRMIERRSLNGSITIVGDIAQATSAWAHSQWDSVIEHLPKRPKRLTELTVGYRLPAPTMTLAAKVLAEAVPGLKPPVSVRQHGDAPRFVAAADGQLHAIVLEAIRHEREVVGAGNVAVIATTSMVDELSASLTAAGVEHGLTYHGALERPVSIIAVSMVKGLEIDSAIVVDPNRILAEEPQPYKSLYVAVTRATRRLTIAHTGELPAVLQ